MHRTVARLLDWGDRLRARPRVFSSLLAAATLAAWTGVAGVAWITYDLTTGLPGRDELRRLGDMKQATTLLDIEGRPAFTIYEEQRIEIPLGKMAPVLVDAIVAIEDQRFRDHAGVDPVRIAGSLVANLRSGRRAQGGSTITQQLARQSFLTADKTLRRKLKEVILAAELERTYSKDEILELYLNKVYFGDGLYGVEAAAMGYFGKHASDLTLAEAALIAGLVKSPSTWAPTVNLDRAVARRAVVLSAMVGSGVITAETAAAARREPVALKDLLRREEPYGLYFKEEVRRQLVERFGWQRVYEGGLTVHTTIDVAMQQAAEEAVRKGLEDIEAQRRRRLARRGKDEPAPEGPPIQGALAALDPRSGEVRALVGGRDFDESHFNRAVQAKRQPGSAFKPFVYAVAIEGGMSPASIIDRLDEPVATPQGAWTPDDEHGGASEMTLRTALRTSSNRAAVRLLQAVGIPETVDYAKKLGVGSVPSVPSLALGSGEVTLLSMTAAYGTFAAAGVRHDPVLIRRVVDRTGEVLYESQPAPTPVLSEATAFLLASMLSDVVNTGTAWKVRQGGFSLPAAGKTGTTNDYVDAWFVGFTPSLVAGVWIGYDQPKTIVANGYGGELAVPVWTSFMKAATKGDKSEWFKPPRELTAVEVCRVSGRLPNDGCDRVQILRDNGDVEMRSMVYTDYFPRNRAPQETCPLHPGRSFLDRLAGVFGKDDLPPMTAGRAGVLPHEAPAAAPAATADPDSRARVKAEEPEKKKRKKRGFWSRVFGIGGDDDKDDDKDEDKDEDKSKDRDEDRGRDERTRERADPPR